MVGILIPGRFGMQLLANVVCKALKYIEYLILIPSLYIEQISPCNNICDCLFDKHKSIGNIYNVVNNRH